MSKKLVDLAALAISVKESPLQSTKIVNVKRAECALKIVVLMSDFSKVSATQRAMVLDNKVCAEQHN